MSPYDAVRPSDLTGYLAVVVVMLFLGWALAEVACRRSSPL